MKPRVTIIGHDHDKQAISTAAIALSVGGYEIDTCMLPSETSNLDSVESDYNLLWVSKGSMHVICETADALLSKGKKCVNLFSEALPLTPQQREIIGRNPSIFYELNPDDWTEDLVGIIDNASMLPKTVVPTPPPMRQSSRVSPSTSSKPTDIDENPSNNENNNDDWAGFKPWKALLVMVGVAYGEYLIECAHEFYNNEIIPYIMFAVCGIVGMSCCGGVIQYREKNGKSFFSALVLLVSILMCLFYGWLIVKNVWNYLF